MVAAVISLAVLGLALGTGLVLAIRYAIEANKTGQNAVDLYRAQLEVKQDLEADIRDLTGKLAATDEQLREAKIRLSKAEQQRDKAVAEAKEQLRQEIRNARDPVAALNKVLAAAPRDSVQRTGETQTGTALAEASAGDRAEAGLQITDLR